MLRYTTHVGDQNFLIVSIQSQRISTARWNLAVRLRASVCIRSGTLITPSSHKTHIFQVFSIEERMKENNFVRSNHVGKDTCTAGPDYQRNTWRKSGEEARKDRSRRRARGRSCSSIAGREIDSKSRHMLSARSRERGGCGLDVGTCAGLSV
ncbi:hypothetical protein MPTK1_2g13290 [Marchantia polymorpha subsp. ruderalis]|uniref:Uncharacterized protein n=1 Tax=Marchantia polymorpha TaxID=3197 RepID=A0A2R6XAL7_MARPO|nr:hypothetical protein MARPO_0026s0043 [Marchantia polymorpha]BBN02159.1 hypothetical protein Mp_2g13290 [Marchantia polymorpha subsp. ruderalis]|eukprot:PTQ43160.1 hypothetical protein MARPO_0026s0043 [Marchantia polymorpha]